jgi:phosphate transport system substrate-binding protein
MRKMGFTRRQVMKNAARFAATLMLMAGAAFPGLAQITLTGAGATFPYPMYSKWFAEYRKAHPNVEINYQSLGSGAGIQMVTNGTVDFGASDGPMTDEQIKGFRDKNNAGILHFPTVLGAAVPTYNIPGVTAELNFTPDTLAGIFLGKITKWNDEAIAKANPGVKLPNADIIVVHRSDSSGTTYVWTDYLSKVSNDWKTKVGRAVAVSWPVGLGGKGSEGVAGQVKQTAHSIGYVELIYAVQNKMSYGKVRNRAGDFVKADLASVTAAAAGVNMPADFRVSITDPTGKTAYPVSTFTWLLIPDQIKDAKKRQVIVDFLKWMLGPGQKMTAALDYAPLPAAVVAKEEQAVSKIH